MQLLQWVLEKFNCNDEEGSSSKQVEMSRDNIIVKFLNYQEDWEETNPISR